MIQYHWGSLKKTSWVFFVFLLCYSPFTQLWFFPKPHNKTNTKYLQPIDGNNKSDWRIPTTKPANYKYKLFCNYTSANNANDRWQTPIKQSKHASFV